MKKLNFWKILLIILIVVFIYNVIDNGIEIYNDYKGKNLLLMILLGLGLSIFQTVLPVFLNPIVFFFGCIYIASKVSSKKVRKQNYRVTI